MMKKEIIRRVALAELQLLFFSPVAWLVLILFTLQTAMSFTGTIKGAVRSEALNYVLSNLTFSSFSDMFGFFQGVLRYLHLYIPLLTMGLMSRDLSSGSIKLLYSSPVRNSQIIIGKFLSMVVYGLMLVAILFVYVLVGAGVIEHFDWPLVLSGLLGIYLLILAYAAIGLFMSSLTSYQIVAAVATIALLSGLNFIGRVGQSIDFVREITYWLSMSGRTKQFIEGLICSEDVLYFLIIMALFLGLGILRLNAIRQKTRWTGTWAKYAGMFLGAMMLGYLSSRPLLMAYHDTTRTKSQSLTKASQDIVAQVKGGLTMTTYVNLFDNDAFWGMPKMRKNMEKEFRQFVRFKPEMKLRYVYYYAGVEGSTMQYYNEELTEEELVAKLVKNEEGLTMRKVLTKDVVDQMEDLSSEGYRFVWSLKRDSGDRVFMRMFDDSQKFPSEREVSAALKRLVMVQPPVVAFTRGHGERDFDRKGDRSYSRFAMDKPFRYSLVNQGFDFVTVGLDEAIPGHINILVIADMREALTEAEHAHLDAYIARGGNLMILGEIRRQEVMNPLLARFGVTFLPGQLVQFTGEDYSPDFIVSRATTEAEHLSYFLGGGEHFKVTMPGAVALSYRAGMGYDVIPLLVTNPSGVWNEQDSFDFVEETPELNPTRGEAENAYPTGIALIRLVNGRQQRIMILGDADCIGNGEISYNRPGLPAANFNLIMGAFNWMSNNELPVDVRRPAPIDNTLHMSMQGAKWMRTMLVWVFPGLLLMGYLILWLRRRGR